MPIVNRTSKHREEGSISSSKSLFSIFFLVFSKIMLENPHVKNTEQALRAFVQM